MPLYEYECPICGQEEEHILTYAEGEVINPVCKYCSRSENIPVHMVRKLGTLATWRYRGGFVPKGGKKYQDG